VQEMPVLERLQATYKNRGLVVIMLSDEPREVLQEFFKNHSVAVFTAYTPSFDWLKIEAFRPFTLFIDRQGILRHDAFGIMEYEAFESNIRPCL
jgi:hypothetical protein